MCDLNGNEMGKTATHSPHTNWNCGGIVFHDAFGVAWVKCGFCLPLLIMLFTLRSVHQHPSLRKQHCWYLRSIWEHQSTISCSFLWRECLEVQYVMSLQSLSRGHISDSCWRHKRLRTLVCSMPKLSVNRKTGETYRELCVWCKCPGVPIIEK